MSASMLTRLHVNGYGLIHVDMGPWNVCTRTDRFGSFNTREEAVAFAASLPAYQARPKKSSESH